MGILDTIVEGIQSSMGFLADAIGNTIMTTIFNIIGIVFYFLTRALMWFVWVLQELFDVFAGTTKVSYRGENNYLINVFFQNESIVNIYWAIALLGMVFVIAFTIIAVVRKTFDMDDQQKMSLGQIMGSMFKSIFTMLILSFCLNAALTLTNITIDRISYIFDNADSFSKEKEIRFTDEQYATMARIYKTIGNYSLNPSYQSRYNLNACFNDIRSDLNLLEQQKVFDLTYVTTENGKTIDTWQSVLQGLVYSADTSKDLRLDKYYAEVSEPLLEIMQILRTNADFKPLDYYQNGYTVSNRVSLDRILFLSGTISAANNPRYNENPFLTDGLRGAFYTGARSIHSLDDVRDAFDIGLTGINYLFIWALSYFTIRNLFSCIFGCVMRIFTMVSLYIIAPLTIASTPLDNGEKFKQWLTSMIIQGLSILGSIIPMRLILLFAPIILSTDLEIFPSITLNFIAKVLLVVGGLEAVEGFGQIVKGILANNAGMAALRSDDKASVLGGKAFDKVAGAAKSVAKVGAKGVGYTALGAGAAVLGAGALGLTAGAFAVAGTAAGIYGAGKGIAHGVNYLRHKYGSKDSGPGGSGGSSGGKSSGPQAPSSSGGDSAGGFSGGDSAGGFSAGSTSEPSNLGGSMESQGSGDSGNSEGPGSGVMHKVAPPMGPPSAGAMGSSLSDKLNQSGDPIENLSDKF